jgi:5'-nucleotidase
LKPLILLINDDGYRAPGLAALRSAVEPLGEIVVIAPDREMSACGQAITIKGPLRAERIDGSTIAVEGTPADCVILALGRLLPRRPDLVLSGINRGANLGDDVFYSGTVGGAREAAFWGLRSAALSLATRGEGDFEFAGRVARQVAEELLREPLPDGVLLNVNVPDRVGAEPRGARVTRQGMRTHGSTVTETRDSRGRVFYWIAEPTDVWNGASDDDITAVREGFVSITPLAKDTTGAAALALAQRFAGPLR